MELEKIVEMAEANQKAIDGRFNEMTDEVKSLRETVEELKAVRKTADTVDTESNEVFQKFLRTGEVTDKKYLVEGTGNVGGFLVPTDARDTLYNKIVGRSPIREYATVLQTSTNKVTVPVESTQFAASWTAEAGNRTNSAGETFGQAVIDVHEMYVRIPVSNALLEDSAVDLEAWLIDRAAAQFAKLEGTAFVNGTGTNQPRGLTAAAAGVAAVETAGASLTADDIISAYYALPAEYAQNAVWLFNRSTLASLRKLKVTANSEFVWQPGFADQPATIMGRPVLESPDLPTATTAGTNIALFGDLQYAYAIADRVDFEVSRDPFSDADKGNTVFRIRRRVGGQVLLNEAAVILKYKA